MSFWPTSGVGITAINLALALTQAVLNLTITSPASGATVTNAAFTITWSFSPGTQQTYQVLIYSDAGATTLVYDSGIVTSASLFHTMPAGALLSGETYYLRVLVTTTVGGSGTSALSTFLTAFTPSTATIAGLVGSLLGGGCGASSSDTLPGVHLAWTQVVPGVGETFVEYDVLKRQAGTTSWTTIARITAVATVVYDDYAVQAGTEYEYAVIWQATTASGTLVSLVQNPTIKAIQDFDWTFVHPTDNAAAAYIRLFNFEPSMRRPQDVSYQQQWGATAPTVYVGEFDYRVFQVPTLQELLSSGLQWEDIESLLTAQMAGSTFCLRFGRAKLMAFVAIDSGSQRNMTQKGSTASLAFTEIDHTEAV